MLTPILETHNVYCDSKFIHVLEHQNVDGCDLQKILILLTAVPLIREQ